MSLASGHTLTTVGAAAAMGLPVRTLERRLAAWFAAGVPGVARVPSRGRYGHRYAIARDLVRRWREGRLPR